MEGFIFSEDLCRLCLWRSNKLLPIFSEGGELQGIPLKIGTCLPISVSRDDVLPKLICSQCIYKLEMFSEFRNSCVRSEQLLKRYTSHETVQVQVQACHTVMVQMQDEVKVEVQESDPISVEHEVPFMCIIPEEVQKAVEEQPADPDVEYNTKDVDTNTIKNLDIEENIPLPKKVPEKKQKVARRKSPLKKPSNKTESLKIRTVQPKHVSNSHREPRNVARLPTLTSSRRNMHRCKHCSKNFPSRVQLSRHLASSNCLFRYTCRYCAKIFGTAETRIHHERNHRDKKNFICRICKQKFQSSFDLNVHTVQGCERIAAQNNQQSPVAAETKKQAQKTNSERTNEMSKQAKTVECMACKYCGREFRHFLSLRKHVNSCRRSNNMTKMQEGWKKSRIKSTKKIESLELKQDNASVQQKGNRSIQRGFSSGVKVKPRKKQSFAEHQTLDTSTAKACSEVSPKASLMAVLGLTEKMTPSDSKATQKPDEINSKLSSDVTEDEVVTVCDICRKIFTSESGMLNHQSTVHNRKLTAEKINSLMRVEI